MMDHFVFPVGHGQLGITGTDWKQAWLGSSAYALVKCTANYDDDDSANDTVQSHHILYGASVKVTARDND